MKRTLAAAWVLAVVLVVGCQADITLPPAQVLDVGVVNPDAGPADAENTDGAALD